MLNKYQLCIRSHQTKGHCNPMVKVLSPHFKGEKKRNKIEAWKLSMFSKGKKKKKEVVEEEWFKSKSNTFNLNHSARLSRYLFCETISNS